MIAPVSPDEKSDPQIWQLCFHQWKQALADGKMVTATFAVNIEPEEATMITHSVGRAVELVVLANQKQATQMMARVRADHPIEDGAFYDLPSLHMPMRVRFDRLPQHVSEAVQLVTVDFRKWAEMTPVVPELYQLVWPDSEGFYPGDSKYNAARYAWQIQLKDVTSCEHWLFRRD